MVLEMAADGFGDRVAIGTRDDGMTFAELRGHATAIAAELGGAHPTVALLAETSPLVPAALFGAAWAGVPYAPLNYRLPAEARDALLARLAPVAVADDSWLERDAPSPIGFPEPGPISASSGGQTRTSRLPNSKTNQAKIF